MHWILALLALFNLVSMVTVFYPRRVPRKIIPWAVFATAMLATELAWLWLPLQIILASLLISAGALASIIGKFSLSLLLLSWPGLAWSIFLGLRSGTNVEQALQDELGANYRDHIPTSALAKLRTHIGFNDFCKPFSMKRPDVEVIRDIPYGPGGIRQQLDIYRPTKLPTEGCPVLLQIHGGAWTIGDKGGQALPLMYALASRGWICVAANYRLSPSVGFPTHIKDCKAALGWIRKHGHQYGMNPEFVAVTGGSAGGHLSALMGLTGNRPEYQDFDDADTSVQACVPLYGVYDFLGRNGEYGGSRFFQNFITGRIIYQAPEEDPAVWDMASPIVQISPDAPPFFIMHGSQDSLIPVKGAREFSNKLRVDSKNPVVYVEFPGAEHAWEIFHSPRTEHTIEGIYRFLEWTRANQQKA